MVRLHSFPHARGRNICESGQLNLVQAGLASPTRFSHAIALCTSLAWTTSTVCTLIVSVCSDPKAREGSYFRVKQILYSRKDGLKRIRPKVCSSLSLNTQMWKIR